MSPRAYIVERVTKGGDKRYHVRYKPRGASTPIHWGSYPNRKLALKAQDYVNGELAVGRYPDPYAIELPPAHRTVLEVYDDWTATYPARSESQKKIHKQARAAIAGHRLAGHTVETIRLADIQALVNYLAGKYSPATVSQYLGPLRQAIDHAELDRPNPARDRRLRLPERVEEQMDPPSWRTFQAILERVPARHRTAIAFLERTGLRIGEAETLTWGDLDLAGRRLRVAAGRTKSRTGGQRWVPLTGDWAERIAELCPVDDRMPDRRVFGDLNQQTIRGVLRRACTAARVAHISPHDLRHRFISLLVLAGVDLALVAKVAGHRKRSVTHDIYSHVLLDEPEWRLAELRTGVSWVSGLSIPDPTETETPANEGVFVEVEDTGL